MVELDHCCLTTVLKFQKSLGNWIDTIPTVRLAESLGLAFVVLNLPFSVQVDLNQQLTLCICDTH